MSSKRSTSRLKGFTLVEILAVLVLFALIAGAIAPNLAGTSRRSQSDKLIADLIDLDARARVLARKHRVCFIQLDETHQWLELSVIDDTSEVVQEVIIPHFAALDIEPEAGVIAFDRFGQTNEYRYTVVIDQTTIQIGFNGRTGWHEIRRGQSR